METTKQNFLDRIGIPSSLAWGYVGVLVFMMGDGMEQGWLSPYLIDNGITVSQSALLFTLYGITIGISSWFSGVFADMFGVKKTMIGGWIIYMLGVLGFVGIAMTHLNYPMMLLTYAIKGFGYPLFAYTFLVWIAYKTPVAMLGKAVGWFWFVFTGGLSVLGAIYSSWATSAIGYLPTLWSALIWATIGAVCIFFFMKFEDHRDLSPERKKESKIKELLKGITIVKKEPKIGIACLVRIIDTAPQFGFPVFLPMYMVSQGFSEAQWLHIWAVALLGNIIFNLIFGFIGDYVGWRKTVMWFGGVGCTIGTLLFYFAPQVIHGSLGLVMFGGFFWGAMMAGYVPLSALVPSLVKEEKGAAMAVLNLGAGLSAFAGPAIVGIFISIVGTEGVIWIIAGLYLLSAIMTKFITLPEEKLGTPAQLRKRELQLERALNTEIKATGEVEIVE